MKSIDKLRKSKGISPVIATVILVAVAITVAVAVAYWMSGIAGQYTSFEKIELPAHYSQWCPDLYAVDDGGWKEHIEMKNSGSKDATITNIFLNNVPIKDYNSGETPPTTYYIRLWVGDDITPGNEWLDTSDISIPIEKGSSEKLILWIEDITDGCSPGTTIDLKIITAAGNTYPLLEVLA